MASNIVFQKLSLDSKDYVKGLRAVQAEQKETTARVAKALGEQSRKHHEASENIKKKNIEVIKSLKEVGKEFKENVKAGTVVAAGAGLASAFTSAKQQAVRSILDISKGMGQLQSRFDLSIEKTRRLRRELSELSTKTGLTGGSVVSAANELIAASGSAKSPYGIDSVAKFSAMGGGEADSVARSVIDYLKGSGQSFNDENVKNLLESVVSMNRNGDLSLEDALRSMTLDPASKAKLGLSNRENAALISSSSNIGKDRASSIAGLHALLSKSVAGLGEGSALSGILGVGGFMKGGKFDMDKLQLASTNLNRQGLNQNDFIKLMEASGINSGEAEGLYAILKDFNKFNDGFKKVLSDQKTLETSFKQATDNLPDSLSRLNEKFAKAAQDIFSPAGNFIKDIIDGNYGKALMGAPRGVADTAKGVWDNKEMVGLGVAGLGLSGAIFKKLGNILGLGVAKGVAVDQMTQGKVQPVYVVNMGELSGGVGVGTGSVISDGASTAVKGGLGGVIAAKYASILAAIKTTIAMGGMSVGGATAGALGGTAALGGGLGYAAGHLFNKYGPTFNGTTSDGFEGGAIERLIYNIEKLVGTEAAKNIQAANKIQLEVIDNGSRFTVRPTMSDMSNTN